MRKLLVLLLFCATPALAAPFLVCDPTADVTMTTFAYQEGTVVTKSPLVAKACHADFAAVTVGSHSYTVWFEDAFGSKSAVTPFTFTRSTGGGPGPAGLQLSPN